MKYCSKCGNELMDEAVICPRCGCAVNGSNSAVGAAAEDSPSMGLNILAFLLPIVGLILFLVMRKETPMKARQIGIFALVGFAIGFVITFATSL